MAYRNSTTASGTTTTPTVAVPTGAAINDIALLFVSYDDDGTTTFAGKWPSGFTAVFDDGVATPDGQRVGLAWKRLSAADTGSYTLTAVNTGSGAPWIAQCALFSGRDTSNPPTFSHNVHATAAASPVPIQATTLTALLGDDLAWISGPDVSATGVGNLHTVPSGYTKRQDDELTFTNLCIATEDNVAAGATGTVAGTFALTSGTASYIAFLARIPVVPASTRRPALGVEVVQQEFHRSFRE